MGLTEVAEGVNANGRISRGSEGMKGFEICLSIMEIDTAGRLYTLFVVQNISSVLVLYDYRDRF